MLSPSHVLSFPFPSLPCPSSNQAPPGFQEQSQEEDHSDRLKDYEDLQAMLEVRVLY